MTFTVENPTSPTFGDGQRRRPIVLQNVQADDSLRVDVRVVDARLGFDGRRPERVVPRKCDVQLEDASFVRRVGRSIDCCLPVRYVFAILRRL